MQDDDTEMVQLLREDGEEVGCEEGRVEVLGDSRRREDNGVLYREVALPSDEQEDNSPLLVHTMEMSSVTSREWSGEEQQGCGDMCAPEQQECRQELSNTNHQVEIDTHHSSQSTELGSTKDMGLPTSGIHGNCNGNPSSIHSNSLLLAD